MKNIEKAKRDELTYTLTSSEREIEDNGAVTVYGIGISDNVEEHDEEDISDDGTAVTELFHQMVDGQVYPEHLQDIVEDFVSEYTVPVKDAD